MRQQPEIKAGLVQSTTSLWSVASFTLYTDHYLETVQIQANSTLPYMIILSHFHTFVSGLRFFKAPKLWIYPGLCKVLTRVKPYIKYITDILTMLRWAHVNQILSQKSPFSKTFDSYWLDSTVFCLNNVACISWLPKWYGIYHVSYVVPAITASQLGLHLFFYCVSN